MDNYRNPTPCSNSFLQETEYNSDIDSEIRREIDYKYNRSKVNSNYVFPRNHGFALKSKIILKRPNKSKDPKYINKIKDIHPNQTYINSTKKLPGLGNNTITHIKTSTVLYKPKHRRIISDTSIMPDKYKDSPYLKSAFILPKVRSIKRGITLVV
ncbi:hypothetical protein SteCoe_13485 [Stentor coeruleus]|uniref:Uncharacterized protein n=1 Tax=Stentor coeruleus TaxID=5963 RepID=A0A1R2C8C3_9CILI|nr:hypothetical protein SteCoe_13485 [Stentor coeruleus]